MKVKVEKKIGDSVMSFETGYLAKQAAAAVLIQYNDTVVLSTAATGTPRPGIDFFPLMCDYRERTCAAGKFPGGFIKREGRPTTKETLTARLIDRPIRPMFAPGFKNEVQCQNFVLSSDKQTDGDVLAMNGTSTACFISPMPFQDPVASTRVARVEGRAAREEHEGEHAQAPHVHGEGVLRAHDLVQARARARAMARATARATARASLG